MRGGEGITVVNLWTFSDIFVPAAIGVQPLGGGGPGACSCGKFL